jgi:exopolyphosphatase/guanosine-5'-triphosphate,3'-diphosphate pyrophosphatase
MQLGQVFVLATAAARDAQNGPAFLEEAGRIIGQPVELLSGAREAYLSAKGVIAGVHQAKGLVGDLGGGSLELIEIDRGTVGEGVSLKLGGLALQDASDRSLKKAVKIVRDALAAVPLLSRAENGPFFAVGGTWRALASLHMAQTGYPLHVMHGYEIPAREAIAFCQLIQKGPLEALPAIASVSSSRRPLLAYGALVLEQVLRRSNAANVVISALGVREGLLYEQLSPAEQASDPLLRAAADLNVLRSRSPRHGEDLSAWVDAFMRSCDMPESEDDIRLRTAACLLADIGWRAHPDYRGEQSVNIIAHAAFAGIDHPGRAFLALAVYFRHAGLGDAEISERLKRLASEHHLRRARLLAALMRVAYPISAAMPCVLPRVPLLMRGRQIVLTFPKDLAALSSDRIFNRLRQLGKLLGRDIAIEIA